MPHTHFGRDAAEAQRFLAALKTGLSKPQKSIPSEWFYDERGSKLFEQITALPEYYPTRTETKILKSIADGLADVAGVGAALIEYGAGASEKTRILLDKFEALEVYVPIDVSRDFLEATADTLRCDYPGLNVQPVIGSFLSELDLPSTQGRRVGFFPGSTVGNLSDEDIRTFFQRARLSLGSDAYFVLGFDLRKSEDVLIRAYDDAAGVTAAFNLNVLARANDELGADFDLAKFKHLAIWNEQASQIEMHLVSIDDQTVHIGGTSFVFASHETIHTENSRKFSIESMTALCALGGWSVEEAHLDEAEYFAVALLK